jgi:ABC-type multidrug transport system fused ATPase/permease subunit
LLVFAFLIIWQAFFVIFQVLSNFWLASEVDDDGANVSQWWLVGVYALLSVASGVFVHLRSQFCVLLGLKGSRAFFYGMTRAVLRAPMSFFDSTPTGRILSRVRPILLRA